MILTRNRFGLLALRFQGQTSIFVGLKRLFVYTLVRQKAISRQSRFCHCKTEGCFGRDAAFLLTVGSFLLTVELFDLQLTILVFCLQLEFFLLTALAFLLTSGIFFAYGGKVRLIRALRECKQRSLTVSKKAPTAN